MFTNYLYIGIGAKSHYYTLHEVSSKVIGSGIQDIYWQNLSQDADVAIEKATEIASQLGIELRTSRKALADKLEEIKRASAEEIEARARKEQEAAEASEKAVQERITFLIKTTESGVYPFGKYSGLEFRCADVGYINWIIDQENSDNVVFAALAKALREQCADLILPKPNQNYVGTPKERKTFNVTVVKNISFQSYYGWTNIVTLVTDDGECLVSKGQFSAKVGSKLKIKATIKEHSKYLDQNQTVIQRVQEV